MPVISWRLLITVSLGYIAIHTHTHLMALWPGLPGLAGTT